jgi:hypothetical protein
MSLRITHRGQNGERFQADWLRIVELFDLTIRPLRTT